MNDTIETNLKIDAETVWKYTIELSLLKTLLLKELISRHEYELILARIRRDYGVTSA